MKNHKLPRPGTIARKVYDVIAEFPGVRVSTAEIAVEAGISSHAAGCHAYDLEKRGFVRGTKPGLGRKAEYWIEAHEQEVAA